MLAPICLMKSENRLESERFQDLSLFTNFWPTTPELLVCGSLVKLLGRIDNLSCNLAVKSPERPVLPNVTVLSTTEIKITWCRVNSNKVEINRYELFIDGKLEYSGLDVMYVAKRLKPWTWYDVKLRACGFFPGSCSPFSMPRLYKTLRDCEHTIMIVHICLPLLIYSKCMELTKLFISLQNQSFFAGKLAENIWIDMTKNLKYLQLWVGFKYYLLLLFNAAKNVFKSFSNCSVSVPSL